MNRVGNDMKVGTTNGAIVSGFLAMIFLCQCETQRTYGLKHSTSYSIAGRTAGEADDSKKIRDKFVNHGFQVDENGHMSAKRNNLYTDSADKLSAGKFQTKDAKLGKSDFNTKSFKTPEYLKMQDYNATKTARESSNLAREGNFDKLKWNKGGKLFRNQSKSATEYAAYDTGQYAREGRKFSARDDNSVMKTMKKAPNARGTMNSVGYRENSSLTLDDVKKMLSPNTYARGTGINN